MNGLLYFLFFCSGMSGLIYQVAWVREFGNVFGNTVYSASLVVAVFMLGLGVGSYVVGVWADRRYVTQPESLLRAYGYAELIVALLGAGISALVPNLDRIAAAVSSYSRDASGWYALSTSSYFLRGAIAIVLLTPITIVMGGTLTLLIRHLARRDLEIGARRTALLYGVNTVGAAAGCFLTDFMLVPAAGLQAAQRVAVLMNLVAAAGAFLLARLGRTAPAATVTRRAAVASVGMASEPLPQSARAELALTSVALALTGVAAMGMEIVWLRHFSLLLGQFRAVFSLLLTVILIGIGAGAFVGGVIHRRTARPAEWLMVAQGVFVASALLGLARASVEDIHAAARTLEAVLSAEARWARSLGELWFNARPILSEVALPALMMGLAFPLGNAVVQRAERFVGRRAGVLYLSNTIGSVCGSLVAGFGLLPLLGIQGAATVLSIAAGLAVLPLYVVSRIRSAAESASPRVVTMPLLASTLTGGLALVLWLQLPPDYVVRRAQVLPTGEGRLLALSEAVTEVIAVTETPAQGTNLADEWASDGRNGAARPALHAGPCAHPTSLAEESGERVDHRLRRRQYHSRRDAPSVGPACRRRGPLQARPGPCQLFQGCQCRCVERSPGVRVRQRWPPASAYAASSVVRPDCARTATHCARGGGSALFPGVLRAGADAPQTGRLHQPVASGVSSTGSRDTGDGPRVH